MAGPVGEAGEFVSVRDQECQGVSSQVGRW